MTVSRKSALDGAAIVGQKQPLDAMPALAELGEDVRRLGGGGAGLGDLASAGDVQPRVAVLAQHADRQRLRFVAADVEPVQRHQVELVLRTVLVRRSHDQFLGADRLGRLGQRIEWLIGRYDHRL